MNSKILERKKILRLKRKKRIRAKIGGTATLPRVSIFRSNKYLSVQAIDDEKAVTLTALHGKSLDLKPNKEGAKALAKAFGEKLKEANIENIVFDRNGYQFHGVIAEFANALRETGINY